MAKDDGYQGALDSIFGFIFSNNKADSKPLRPPKPTGVSATNDFAAALVELASKPATYLPDEVLNRVDDFIDADLLRFELLDHKDKDKGAIRIRTKDLGKILADPNKYFDKQVKDVLKGGNSSLKQLITGGTLLDQAIGYGVSKYKLGVDNDTAQSIGWMAGNRMEMSYEGAARSKGWKMMAENAIMDRVSEEGISKAKAKSLINSIRSSTANRYDERHLGSLLKSAGIGSIGDEIIEGYKKDFLKKYGKHMDMGMMSMGGFGNILSDNLKGRQKLETGEAQLKLRKAQILVDTWKSAGLSGKGDFPNYKATIQDLDLNITALERSTNSADKVTLSGLRESRKQLVNLSEKNERLPFWKLPGEKSLANTQRIHKAMKADLDAKGHMLRKDRRDAYQAGDTALVRDLNRQLGDHVFKQRSLLTAPPENLAYTLGRYRKYSSYLKDLRQGKQGGLISGGAFFAQQVNEGAPGTFSGFNLQRKKNGEYDSNFWGGIVVPREDINPYLAEITTLQYFTPGSITKTFLLNGEAFVYFAGRQQKHFIRGILKNENLMDMLKGDSRFKNIWLDDKKKPIDMSKEGAIEGAMGGNFLELMDLLEKDSRWGKMLGVSGVKQKYESLSKLAFRFSAPQRLLMKPYQDWVEKNIKKQLDAFVSNQLLKLFKGNQLWEQSVGDFLKRGMGLRQLIQQGVSTALGALTGPLGVIASYVVTESIMKVIPGLISGILKSAILLIWGVVFFIGGTIMMATSTASRTNAWNHRFPENPLILATENPFGPELLVIPEDDIPDIGDAPPGSTCPLLGGISCNQGPDGYYGAGTHRAMPTGAIDTGGPTTWFAPANGTVTSYSPSNTCSDGKDYGGVLIFTDEAGNSYRMLHVTGLITGGKVAKGKPVAVMRFDLEYSGCWGGAHFHLDTKVGGTWTDSEVWYREKLNCSLGTCPPS